MQAFKCCILKLGSFDLSIYYSIQKWKLLVRVWLLFNITTILTKMVLNYFEVMINYIIAVSLHARRNNLMSLCSYQHSQWWYYDRHEFILDWLCLHSWTQNLCITQGESDLHLPRLSLCHAIPPQFSSVKQMNNKCEWDGKTLFMFYILRSWAVLDCWITFVVHLLYRWKLWRNGMTQA